MGKTTTEMKLVETSKLIPYVNNARTHSGEQINKRVLPFVSSVLSILSLLIEITT